MSQETKRPEPVMQPTKIVDTGTGFVPAPPIDPAMLTDLPSVAARHRGTPVNPDAEPNRPVGNIKRFQKKPSGPSKPLIATAEGVSTPPPPGFDRNKVHTDMRGVDLDDKNLIYPDDSRFGIKGLPVKIAWLQTPASISGFVSSESTFEPRKINGLTMLWINHSGLLCRIQRFSESIEFLIPEANVKLCIFKPVETENVQEG